VLENNIKKGGQRNRYPPKMGMKKGKGIPISSGTPLPVIVLSYYREKGKTYPISNRAIIALLLSSTPLSAYQ
jgi:hypothetical protein